jgi:hypothetical protein
LSVFSKGVNRAAQMGYNVPAPVLAADQKANTSGLNLAKGTFTTPAAAPGAGPGGVTAPAADAGVPIYSSAGKTSGLQEAVNTLEKAAKKNEAIIKSQTATKEAKHEAQRDLDRLKEARVAQTAAVDGLIRRLDDKTFLQGFGSNGGEEFLSYMNLSETLVVRGGKDWAAWDKGICDALSRVQDKDGGWSGQHCIIGRTFYLASFARPDGSSADTQPILCLVYTTAGAVQVLSHPSNERHRKARDAWLGYLRQRQLTEELGWQPADRPYGGWGYAPHLPRKPRSGEPLPPLTESNLSATVFALEALRAAGSPRTIPPSARR